MGEVFHTVTGHAEPYAGTRSHTGKLEAWSRSGGAVPPNLPAVNGDAWTVDRPDNENGIVVLGVPLGTPAFASAHAIKRMEVEEKMLQALPETSCQVQCM